MAQTDHNIGTLTSDGSTPWTAVKRTYRNQRGLITLAVEGTFGGGTALVEASRSDGGAVLGLGPVATVTANSAITVDLPANNDGNEWYLRVTLSGATGANISAYIA